MMNMKILLPLKKKNQQPNAFEPKQEPTIEFCGYHE